MERTWLEGLCWGLLEPEKAQSSHPTAWHVIVGVMGSGEMVPLISPSLGSPACKMEMVLA